MNLVVLPILVPAVTGLALLFLQGRGRLRRWIAASSAAAQLGIAAWLLVRASGGGPLMSVMGDWPAAIGIVMVVDVLSALMLALSAVTTLAAVLFAFAEQSVRVEHPLRLTLLMLLVAGINLSFVTADLFNLFVAFEVVLIASAALLTLEADDWEVKHAFPYLLLNQVGSALFLVAAGIAYGMFGTLNFALLAERTSAVAGDPRVTLLALLLLAVFGIKAGLFPLYYWLPNSYPTLPTPLGALYAALLTKVGVYAIIRVYGTVLPPELPVVHMILAWIAGATIVLGTLGAIARDFIRGMLALLLTQVGFMVMAVGFFGAYAFTAAIYYLVHHVVVMATLFMVGGVVLMLNRTDHLERTGNLWRAAPAVAIVFLLQALSLAGVPPFSGFWGKYMILVRGIERGETVLVAAALLTSLLTLVVMLRIWNRVFWRRHDEAAVRRDDRRWKTMAAVTAGLTAVSLWIGLHAELFLQLASQAAAQVLDRAAYVEFVTRSGL